SKQVRLPGKGFWVRFPCRSKNYRAIFGFRKFLCISSKGSGIMFNILWQIYIKQILSIHRPASYASHATHFSLSCIETQLRPLIRNLRTASAAIPTCDAYD
ncbi:hypothetical protein SFRURICE_005088, partial [Spodoptera frugiperda]